MESTMKTAIKTAILCSTFLISNNAYAALSHQHETDQACNIAISESYASDAVKRELIHTVYETPGNLIPQIHPETMQRLTQDIGDKRRSQIQAMSAINEGCLGSLEFNEAMQGYGYSIWTQVGPIFEEEILKFCSFSLSYIDALAGESADTFIAKAQQDYQDCDVSNRTSESEYMINTYICAKRSLENTVFQNSFSMISLLRNELEQSGTVTKNCGSPTENEIAQKDTDISIQQDIEEYQKSVDSSHASNDIHAQAAEIFARGREATARISMRQLPSISETIVTPEENQPPSSTRSQTEDNQAVVSSRSIPTPPPIRREGQNKQTLSDNTIPTPPRIWAEASTENNDVETDTRLHYEWNHPSYEPNVKTNIISGFALDIIEECYDNYYSSSNLCEGRLFRTKTRHVYENFKRLVANGTMCFTGPPLFHAYDPDFDGQMPNLIEFEGSRYIAVHAVYQADNIYRTSPIDKVFKFEKVSYEGQTYQTLDLLDIVINYPNGERLSFVENCSP